MLCVPGPGTYVDENSGLIAFDSHKPQCATQVCNNDCIKDGYSDPLYAYNGECEDGRGEGPGYCDLGTDCQDCHDQGHGETYEYVIRSGADSHRCLSWLGVAILHAVLLMTAAEFI